MVLAETILMGELKDGSRSKVTLKFLTEKIKVKERWPKFLFQQWGIALLSTSGQTLKKSPREMWSWPRHPRPTSWNCHGIRTKLSMLLTLRRCVERQGIWKLLRHQGCQRRPETSVTPVKGWPAGGHVARPRGQPSPVLSKCRQEWDKDVCCHPSWCC